MVASLPVIRVRLFVKIKLLVLVVGVKMLKCQIWRSRCEVRLTKVLDEKEVQGYNERGFELDQEHEFKDEGAAIKWFKYIAQDIMEDPASHGLFDTCYGVKVILGINDLK